MRVRWTVSDARSRWRARELSTKVSQSPTHFTPLFDLLNLSLSSPKLSTICRTDPVYTLRQVQVHQHSVGRCRIRYYSVHCIIIDSCSLVSKHGGGEKITEM